MTGVVFVEQRPMEGREVEAAPDAVIGREGVEIVLADPEVSRRHAAIRAHGDGVAIEDLGSTNGTFVNDQRLTGLMPLNNGDTVRLGNTVWSVRVEAPAAPATSIGQAPAEVTAARAIPSDLKPPASPPTAPQPPAAPAAPAAAPVAAPAATAAPPVHTPAQPAAPSAEPVGPRGDVPQPAAEAPSAIRRVLPPPIPGQPSAFSPPGGRQITTKTGSQATRVEATIVCLIIVLLVAVAVTVYFAAQ